jgi:hypothetical protein
MIENVITPPDYRREELRRNVMKKAIEFVNQKDVIN